MRWFAPVAIASAGIVHLVIAPQHAEHSSIHAVFFILAGLAETTWAVMFYRRPSPRALYLGAVMAGGLVVLWGLTRVFPAPFGHGPEAWDTTGSLLCKGCELAGLAGLLALTWQGRLIGSTSGLKMRTLAYAFGLALLSGLGSFGAGHAAAWLTDTISGAEPSQAAPHSHSSEQPETHNHEATPAEHGHDGAPATRFVAGQLHLSGAWSRPAAAGDAAAVYLTIANRGEHDEALLGVDTQAAATAGLHATEMQGDVARMIPLSRLEIPAGATVELTPGDLHIMLSDLVRPLVAGARIPLILHFEHSGEVLIEAEVIGP